jgi:hypothetical protein
MRERQQLCTQEAEAEGANVVVADSVSDSQLSQDAPPHLPNSVAMASAVKSRTNGSRGNQDGVLAGYCAEQCTKVLFGSCAGTNRKGRASARGWGTSYASCTETMPNSR